MIFVLLKGGLGNQIFQYRLGQVLAQKYSTKVSYCIEKNGFGYCLDKIGINLDIIESRKMNFFASKRNYLIKALKKVFPNLTYHLLKLFNVYYWDSPKERIVKIKNNNKNKYVIGYWQFNDLMKNNDIDIRIKPSSIARHYMSLIDDCACFVHVRRGDYVNHKYLFVCDEGYYLNAMEKMESIKTKVSFFVFSNDIDWCKKAFNRFSCVFVDDINNDSQELFLLSLFKNAIISNSTFSYCAINIGVYPKIVIAPKKWRKGRLSKYRAIYDDRWLLI